MDEVKDRYFTTPVSHALRMRTGELRMITSGSQNALANLGDGTAVALMKLLSHSQLVDEHIVKQYLPIIEDSFAKPQFITLDDNKIPRATIFLLNSLMRYLDKPELRSEIQRLTGYVEQQTNYPHQ